MAALSYIGPDRTVEIPIYVHDLSGSPVGLDIDKSIRYLQFTITFSQPELIKGCTNQTFPACKVWFRSAGVLARKAYAGDPITFVDSTSILVRRVIANTIDWNLDGDVPDLIGYLQLTAAPDAPPGSEIALEFSSSGTFLGDQPLTVSEAAGNGLQLKGGRIVVADCSGGPKAEEYGFSWIGGITGCTPESGGCQSGETMFFTAFSTRETFGACETISWSLGDGSHTLPDSDNTTSHQYAPGTYDVAMTVTTAGGSTTVHRALTITHPCMLPPPAMSLLSDGESGLCGGLPTVCATDEIIRFTAKPPSEIAGCTTYEWNFGDGTQAVENGAAINHAYTNNGTYSITSTARTEGGQRVLHTTVKVGQPIACSAHVPTSAVVNEPVLFDATANIAGAIYYWFWMDDGTYATIEEPQKAFSSTGVKSWSLLVSHSDYAACRQTGSIAINGLRRRAARNDQ